MYSSVLNMVAGGRVIRKVESFAVKLAGLGEMGRVRREVGCFCCLA